MARKILLADDSVTAQNMGRKILTDAGYEVITVNNGSAALKKIAESKPDLIVLDVYMPGYSGLEVCQRIKENRETARIPVLLTVGKLEPFKPEEARRARADAFVVKPFEASELLAALTKLEDKIIPAPEPYKPGRFARAVASVDQDADEKFGDSDAGWKARLRIPTGPPKERDAEPDVDYAATQGKAFKDFEESSATKDPAKPASKNGDFERPIPAGLPRDITPEEISAIAAAAAQLRGKKTDEVTPKPTARKAAVTPPEMPVAEAPEEAAPVTFASSPTLSEPQPEPISAAAPDLSAVEVAPTDSENEAAVPPTEAATPIEAVSDTTISAAVPEFATTEVAAEIPELPVEAVAPPPEKSHSIPAAQDEPETEAATPAAEEASVSSTDDEVMAALQTLMPTSSADSPTVPSLSESASTPVSEPTAAELPGHGAGPHWIAEEIALADDEATLSLEAEMAKAHAGNEISPVAAVESSDSPIDAISAVAAISEESRAPALDTPEQPTAYAMASAAAAAGDVSSVPLASSTESPVYESAAIEAPAVRNDSVSEPDAVTTASAEGDLESETVGGTDIMAANWKNIRDSIAGAAPKPAPSKEEFQETPPETPEPTSAAPMPTPSTQAPAAQRTPLSASDPTAIANIVDSVLAELRPKIVEEIARKLSDSKK